MSAAANPDRDEIRAIQRERQTLEAHLDELERRGVIDRPASRRGLSRR